VNSVSDNTPVRLWSWIIKQPLDCGVVTRANNLAGLCNAVMWFT